MTRGVERALGILVMLSLALSACATPTPVTIIETVVVEKTVEVEREPDVTGEVEDESEPPTETSKTLVICMENEPDSLYRYGNPNAAAALVQQAIYDGPIDNRGYAYHPVILRKLPSLDDGDAIIRTVTVQIGDIVVDANGNPVELLEGTPIHPSGCRRTDCMIEFDGVPIDMDQMVVTFELTEGLTWSNGDPLTVDDSIYSFELNADFDSLANRYSVDRTASYAASSNTTVTWTGVPGYVDDLYFTNFWHPFPRSLWQDELGFQAADLLEVPESTREPMGWGPFVVNNWVSGNHITMTRNPYYFRADEGLPHLDTVIFRFVSDPNAVIAQLISGECDIAVEYPSLMDYAELLLQLEQENVVKPVFTTSAVWELAGFGIDPAPDYERPNFFGDVRVRQAIAMCLDRQRVVDDLLYGRSVVINSYVPPTHPLYADSVSEWPHDPEAGRALLEEVGWLDADGDGIREASDVDGIADGTRLEFSWQSTGLPVREAYLQLFRQNLADCGVGVDLEILPTEDFYADGPAGALFGRRFDMASFAWMADVIPLCDLYLSSSIPTDVNGWDGSNNTGFSSESYDEQCLRAISALPGTVDSIEGHRESQRIFTEQLPAIPLFLHLSLAVTREEVQGFVPDAVDTSGLWAIEAFDLE